MMKTLLILPGLLLMFSLLFTGCSKQAGPPPPTSLQITLKDEQGYPLPGASVKLFASQSDWLGQTNQIGATQTSDANGVVTFTNLSAIKYFWWAQKDCKSNLITQATTQSALTANTTNTVVTQMQSSGTLQFNNTSSNPYQLYINGQYFVDISGGASLTLQWQPLGNYTFRVVQKSGYAFTPTDETITGSVTSCGGTLTTTFP